MTLVSSMLPKPARTFRRCQALVCLLLSALAGSFGWAAEVRILEESTIPYTRFLSKADFDQRFPGEPFVDNASLDVGWYVIYEHESLGYYFGPILLESTGRDYLEQLREIVEAAVAQRPSITDYRLELSYEPSGPASPSPQNSPPAAGSGNPPPPPPPSIWGFFKRLFGFG